VCLRLLAFPDERSQPLDVDLAKTSRIGEQVVFLRNRRVPGCTYEHSLKDESCQLGRVRPAVEVTRFLGCLPIVGVLGIRESATLRQPAGEIVRERVQHETPDDAQFVESEQRLDALHHFRQQPVA
jgi:hypothetical protein